MLNISRKVFNLRGFKCLKILPRAACSGRFSQSQTIDTLQNAGKEESLKEKDGYGEKEIFLLGPADVRTPLPGNMGIPPLSLFYNFGCSEPPDIANKTFGPLEFIITDTISKLPEPAGEKCEVTTSQLPEERYSNLLTQAACVVSENILSSYPLECVGYDCPQLLKKDFSSLFPSRDLTNRDLTVITLCQKTENNMSEWSEKAELERASLETSFVTIARVICAQLKLNNYWADFIQPNSGKPNYESLTSATLFETDLRYRHFGFTIEDLGCCRIIMHTKWGAHMFVGAIFTNAPLQSKEVQNVLEHHKSIQTVF